MKTVSMKLKKGLHVGPCYELSKWAKQYPCSISVKTRRGKFNAKSGLQLLQAGLEPDEYVEFYFNGDKETQASIDMNNHMEQFL